MAQSDSNTEVEGPKPDCMTIDYVVITGSRHWRDEARLKATLAEMAMQVDRTVLIVGGARGADTMAECWATGVGVKVKRMPADWKRYGKRAGFLRNSAMLAFAQAAADHAVSLGHDARPVLVAFRVPGTSNGTDHTVGEAQRRDIQVHVHHEQRPCTAGPSHWWNDDGVCFDCGTHTDGSSLAQIEI